MGWVWDWVSGLGNISRITENVGDSDFQYSKDLKKSKKRRISNISSTTENLEGVGVHLILPFQPLGMNI